MMADRWPDLTEAKRALAEGSGHGIRVAVLDSGVEAGHPRLGIKLVDDLAVVAEHRRLHVVKGGEKDSFGHGTAVAGVIHEIAPEARIGSIRVLGHDNTSRTSIIGRAAEEALDRDYQIINCSFGCGVEQQVLDYKSWVDAAYLKGVHVVAACDNIDFSKTEWPAYFPSVVAVNMADTKDGEVFFRQRDTLVEFSARGVDVTVAWAGGGEKVVTGSSFAAPRLAGMLARLLSVFPELSPLEAKAILQKLALPWTKKIAAQNVWW
ncbi:MAG TPA: S8 family serine peptidase [Candidatus Acidoferrales bacterium]|nr:S8 family serine peptidase [Candidatus Acidoferrales bacterium]